MTLIDSLIIFVYLAGIVAIGVIYRGKQDNIDDYFTAQKGFAGVGGIVLVGLSLGATMFSALSFVAYPSIVYTYGITAMSSLVCFPVAYCVLRFWFLPRYLAQPQSSPYDIIERRFGVPTRLVASGLFVFLRLCWMAALIYAPVIVVMASANLGQEWFWPLVLLIGLLSTLYTVVGGIRGVIITDAIQLLLIMAVLLGTICYVLFKVPLTLSEVSNHLQYRTNLLELNWSFDPTVTITVWAMVIGAFMQNMSTFTADQMSLQRYLTTGGLKSAASAFGTSMAAMVVVLLMLAAVGLTVGTWYDLHPDPLLPNDADKVFPYFVATQLPVGFMGIVIAAILAATMSSITSGINALSGSLLNDFAPLSERVEPGRLLNYARWTCAGIGLVATIVAGFIQGMGTLFDIMNAFYGIFLGPLLACMFCTVAKIRINARPLIGGMCVGSVAGFAVAYSPLSNLWVSCVSSFVTVAVAWTVTRLTGGRSPTEPIAST
jgi:Na+/proline symporter